MKVGSQLKKKEMKVKMLIYNWHQCGSSIDRDGSGEDYSTYEVGKNGVVEIIEDEPRNGLQKWNYVIEINDGTKYRVFNPNLVEYFK